jgi:hypothetical protein
MAQLINQSQKSSAKVYNENRYAEFQTFFRIPFKEGEVPKLLANEILDLREAGESAAAVQNQPSVKAAANEKTPVKIRIPDDRLYCYRLRFRIGNRQGEEKEHEENMACALCGVKRYHSGIFQICRFLHRQL